MLNSLPLTRRFTEQDIVTWFGTDQLARARPYIARVSQLHVGASEITALVQGTQVRPYAVRISFKAEGKKNVSALCTCPVGSGCKHCAAALLAAIEQRAQVAAPPPVDAKVLEWLASLRAATDTETVVQPAQREQLFYLLDLEDVANPVVMILKGRGSAGDDLPPRAEPWNNIERALTQPPKFVARDDLPVLRLLWLARSSEGYFTALRLRGQPVEELLPRLIGTGRCYARLAGKTLPLRAGTKADAKFEWHVDERGMLRAVCRVTSLPNAVALATQPPWYVDAASAKCGALRFELESEAVQAMFRAPVLDRASAAIVAHELAEHVPQLPRPEAAGIANLRTISAKPQAIITVASSLVALRRRWRDYWPQYQQWLDYARVSFDYAGIMVSPGDAHDYRQQGEETVRLQRDRQAETAMLATLTDAGFAPLAPNLFYEWSHGPGDDVLALASEEQWEGWQGLRTRLRTAGWKIVQDASFRHNHVDVDELFVEVEQDRSGWLDVSLGFELDGRRIALAPLLAQLLREHPEWASAKGLELLPDARRVTMDLADGQRVRIAAARIKPLMRMLIDLFDGGERLRLSAFDAPRLQQLAGTIDMRGMRAVQAAAERMLGAQGVVAVAAPPGLGVTLRPYQLEGLAWLQHLRVNDLAGILADDMGLGKTAQTLAHILTEKQAGRLDKPVLVVLPTSLVFNWKREAAHIAPALKVLALHGPQRDLSQIGAHDVVLTTYPLVWRDAEALGAHEFHMLILDEAQTVKNAASKAAAVVRQIRARHRLCLTGTPMENHLGELWSQFDFLLPGFLGDAKDFNRRWRNPIEKGGDTLRRELLSARVKPFILRRRKEDVAKELPPKNIVLRTVELAGGQRDLYETVRSAMDDKVREQIASRGLARSHIVILEALLKLRQVCCDPRLLDMPSALRVKERAKLQLLMQMLPELIDEGRRILLFSQFTSMLDLIAAELADARIPFAMLTGQSSNREAIVAQFQDGHVPVFLISLKAGGVGLNLTRADTVIHFDPWWNPAAENQATDRAHRIGQTQSLFVYKLIAAGSIEERIIALQDKKAALAAAVLSGDAQGEVKFSESDLVNLFAPLPDMPVKPPTKRGRPPRGDS